MNSQVSSVDSKRATLSVHEPSGQESDVGVRYVEAGAENTDEPPIVLLHGIGLDAATVSWKHVVPALGTDRRVLALDFPGHGKSQKPARSYTTPYYNAVLEAFLEALELDRVVLCGISMGGGIALGHALSDPKSVSELVLVDSHGLGRDAPWRAPGLGALWTPFFDSVLQQSLRDPTAVALSVQSTAIAPDREFIADVGETVSDPAVVRALVSWQRSEFKACGLATCYLDRLDELSMPTLLVHGREDPIFPVSWSERANERIPNSTFQAIDRCGHWTPREHPQRFLETLNAFLADEPAIEIEVE